MGRVVRAGRSVRLKPRCMGEEVGLASENGLRGGKRREEPVKAGKSREWKREEPGTEPVRDGGEPNRELDGAAGFGPGRSGLGGWHVLRPAMAPGQGLRGVLAATAARREASDEAGASSRAAPASRLRRMPARPRCFWASSVARTLARRSARGWRPARAAGLGGPSIRRQSQCVFVARGEPGTSGAGGPMAGWFHWVGWRKVVLDPPLGWHGRQAARNGNQGNPGGAAAGAMITLHPGVQRLRPSLHDWNDVLQARP